MSHVLRKRWLLGRRAVLRGAGGVAIGLPWLQAMEARGQAAIPKRLGILFSADGTQYDRWKPTGTAGSFTLSPILQPLAAHSQDLIIVDGTHHQAADFDGNEHMRGFGGMLTGTRVNESTKYPTGMSIDQRVGLAVGGNTRFRTLELGVMVRAESNQNTRMVYREVAGRVEAVPPIDNPWTVFDRVFKDLTTSGAPEDLAAARLREERNTVLGAVKGDYASLRAKLGSEDRQRLEAHLSAIAEIEARLNATAPSTGGSCIKPALGTPLTETNANIPALADKMMDLLAMAFACDLTRVATLQWAGSQNSIVHSWAEVNGAPIDKVHHPAISHGGTDAERTAVHTWYARQFARLIDKLKALPEGDGSVFDNTVLYWCTDMATGNHTFRNMPLVLAGSCGGYFRTGRFVQVPGKPMNNVLVSLANAMGVTMSQFGTAGFCTGPLTELNA